MTEQTSMTQPKSRVSKLKAGIAALALGALLVIPAGAQDTATSDATFEITEGDLTASLTIPNEGIDSFGNIIYSFEGGSTSATAGVGVTDERGTHGGWAATLSATDFTGTSDNTISNANFFVTGQDDISASAGNTDDVDLDTFASSQSLDGDVTLASAEEGSGTGDFSWSTDLEVQVTSDHAVDTYLSTVTLTVSEAPDGN